MKKLMAIAVLMLLMTGSAWAAAEWNFYGSARISTFYSDIENNPFLTGTPNTDNFEMDNNGNARVGANIKVSDTLTGRFEFGAKNADINLRILWGEWDFGAGSLGVGQNYTPLLMPYSNQVYNIYARKDGDTNMSLFGMLYGKREPMIRLKFGNFQIAAVAPRLRVYSYATTIGTAGSTAVSGTAAYYNDQPNSQVKLPNIQAKYKIDFDCGHINLAGGYQTYDLLDNGEEFKVESYVLALGGRLNVGKAYFKGDIWGGQNVGNLADILVSGSIASTMAAAGGGDLDGAGLGFARWSDGNIYTATAGAAGVARGVTNNDAIAGLIVAGYEIRKGLYVEAGYGYTRTELDVGGATKDDAETWYVQSTIFLAPGVFITPEIGGFNGKQTGDPDIFYYGAKWQINF
ncbi:MAG: hypothetical protein HUN04_24145 [Desulfobacter sp.]|nr:MAG: hypothetical protein HUN04_24145 [Desulfobacter sp.]